MFRGKFGHLIGKIKILHLQPGSVPNLELIHRGLFYRLIECLFGLFPPLHCNLNPIFCLLIL
jgi:hypothetical protein